MKTIIKEHVQYKSDGQESGQTLVHKSYDCSNPKDFLWLFVMGHFFCGLCWGKTGLQDFQEGAFLIPNLPIDVPFL